MVRAPFYRAIRDMAIDMATKKATRLRAPTPRAALAKIRALIEAGASVALDEYAGEYQCTVYPNGKAGPNIMDHHHYEAKTLEEAILLAANNHLPR